MEKCIESWLFMSICYVNRGMIIVACHWEDSGKGSSLGSEDMYTLQGGKPAHSVGEDAKQGSFSLFHSPERK